MRRVSALSVLVLGACAGADALGPKDLAKVPTVLVVVSGDAQSDTVSAMLSAPITVRLVSQDGASAPVTGVVVNFVVVEPGFGRPFAGSAQTDRDGRASERWELGTKAGTCTMEARAVDSDGSPRVLTKVTATVRAGTPNSFSSGGAAAWLGDTIDVVAALKPKDRYGNLAGTAAITFGTLPGGVTAKGSKLWSSRELSAPLVLQLGSVSMRDVGRMTWYPNLIGSRWKLEFACKDPLDGSGVDSLVASGETTGISYVWGPPEHNAQLNMGMSVQMIAYRGSKPTTIPFPSPHQMYQQADSVQFLAQNRSAVRVGEDRFEGPALCDQRWTGTRFQNTLRPMVMERIR